MATAKLTVADAAACKAMHDAAIPDIQAFWPGTVDSFDLATWQALVGMGGWKSSTGSTMRSFIITPRRQEPLTSMDAEEMFIWIAPTSLSNAAFAAATRELMNVWFNDLVARGIPRWWSRNVMAYPTRTENWFQGCITRGGMPVTVVDGWRIVVMDPALAIMRLALV